MSVQEQMPIVVYVANGNTNRFAITFDLHDQNYLVVTLNNEVAQVGSYSVLDGEVVFGTAPADGSLVTLYRDTQLNRTTNYKSYDNSFRPESVNWDFDKLWHVLQEQNLIDGKILARIKDEIEWRRTHDFNYDELAQVREKQLFDALKGYADTLYSATNPNVFAGVIAGVVFARDGKSIQTHIEEILDNLALSRSYVDEQLSLKAPQATTYSKSEVDSALSSKAPQATTYSKSEVDTKFSAYVGGRKGYTTLALAQADQANLAANTVVEVTNDGANNGTYQWNGTALTKSDYDPLMQAKNYADQKTISKVDGVVGKNLFDKSKVISGKALGDTGGEIVASTRSVSDFITVLPNTAYSFTATNKICFYDADKNFVQLSNGALANVISAATAAFMRIDVVNTSLDLAQAEKNTSKTAYEPFGYRLKDSSVSEMNLKDGSVSESKLSPLTVSSKHLKDAAWLNMHDPSLLRKGVSVDFTDGLTETAYASFDLTEYIPCLPNTEYACATHSRAFFYQKDGSHISNAAFVTPFTTPADCYYMRFQISHLVSNRFQVNVGATVPATQQPHKFSIPQLVVTPQTQTELRATLGRKYNLSDAWVAWRNGEKFPICFLGDSTTNGNGTTGYIARPPLADGGYDFTLDYIAPNSYGSVFQSLVREITGNTTMRAYNAGFSGQRATWALANIDKIMGYAYADAKMIGISHGINDRTDNPALFSTNFYRDIEGIIKWCLDKGIQPFLLTTQPTTIPEFTGSASGSDIEEVGNEIKRNLAAKYNLEIVDVNRYGQQFMQYSIKPLLNNIMEANSNVIHFGDGGHKFTAELMFAHFCKRCIWTTDGERLDYSTQLMKSEIEHGQIVQINPFKQGFKVELNTTQATAENKLLQEFWVFNAGRKQLNLSAYYANAAVGQYVEVNGVQTTITQQEHNLGTLDLGLHKIKAYSGATTQLDWLGFKLKTTSQ